jgi:hypothetical protein
VQGPAAAAQQDACESQAQKPEAQRQCQRAHDRPAPAGAIVLHDRRPNSAMPAVLPLAAQERYSKPKIAAVTYGVKLTAS